MTDTEFVLEPFKPFIGPRATVDMYRIIPSALLMYRLAATFPLAIQTTGKGGYKSVWHVSLKHIGTGEMVGFGEHKGGASMWTRFLDVSEMPEAFRKDLLDLCKYLFSERCAHPYDGLVAGSVAGSVA